MRSTWLRGVLVTAVILLLAVALWIYAVRWAPSRKDYPVQGVAVANEAGAIHWPTARASGVNFAYLRATVGANGRDPHFGDHWLESRKAGVRRGAWHQFSLCQSANDQANNFVAVVPREKDELRPAILLDFHGDCDARPAKEAVLDEIRLLAKVVEQQTGKPAILWVSRGFDAAYGVSEGIKRDLWLQNGYFPPSYGARTWLMWEANSHRLVNGIEQPVAWSVLYPR